MRNIHRIAFAASLIGATVLAFDASLAASTEALAHASSESVVGEIATYKNAMNAAMAQTDHATQVTDIAMARQQLALSANKQLTPAAATKLDGLLGISGADPALGTSAP